MALDFTSGRWAHSRPTGLEVQRFGRRLAHRSTLATGKGDELKCASYHLRRCCA